jgi:WXG100 family type VII secretion target
MGRIKLVGRSVVAEPVLHVDVNALVGTAGVLSRTADDLEAELARIVAEWTAVRAGWSGLAASNYELSWEDWQHGARTVTAMLSEMSDYVSMAARAFVEHEASRAAATTLRATGEGL